MSVIEAPPTGLTLEEFAKLPDSDHMELIDGVPVEKQMAVRETFIAGEIAFLLRASQGNKTLGHVGVETLLRIDPDDPKRGRRPDVMFISHERLADRDITGAWLDVCPEICVEVVSPNDTSPEVAMKIAEYLAAGAKLVWEVQPEIRTVIAHRPDGNDTRLTGDDELTGEDLLPTFRVAVSKLFP